LPANATLHSGDVDFSRYILQDVTASDGEHTFFGPFRGDVGAEITTDGMGNLISWSVDSMFPLPTGQWESISMNNTGPSFSGVIIGAGGLPPFATVSTVPGTWTVTPEPGSLVTLGTAVVGFGWLEWKRRRRRQ
jgi:hypothetical protein